MSKIADYEEMASSYDEGRTPNGAHLYLGLIYSLSQRPAQDVYLLDAGCGTGSHVKELLQRGLGRAALFDASPEMIERCRWKLRDYVSDGRVSSIEQHHLPTVPFPDATFDAVMFNHVLHHLDSHDLTRSECDNFADEFPKMQRSLHEAYRVLKPNGVIIVNAVTRYQNTESSWYIRLLPEVMARDRRRHPDQQKVGDALKEIGFTEVNVMVLPLDLIMKPNRYYQRDGLLSAAWRSGDSSVASAPQSEIDKAIELLQEMESKGTLGDFIEKSDVIRRNIGQYVIYCALKADPQESRQ